VHLARLVFSQTDFTEDMKGISIPVLVIHGDDDQVVPYGASGVLSAKLVKNGRLDTYQGRAAQYSDDACRPGQCRPVGTSSGRMTEAT